MYSNEVIKKCILALRKTEKIILKMENVAPKLNPEERRVMQEECIPEMREHVTKYKEMLAIMLQVNKQDASIKK